MPDELKRRRAVFPEVLPLAGGIPKRIDMRTVWTRFAFTPADIKIRRRLEKRIHAPPKLAVLRIFPIRAEKRRRKRRVHRLVPITQASLGITSSLGKDGYWIKCTVNTAAKILSTRDVCCVNTIQFVPRVPFGLRKIFENRPDKPAYELWPVCRAHTVKRRLVVVVEMEVILPECRIRRDNRSVEAWRNVRIPERCSHSKHIERTIIVALEFLVSNRDRPPAPVARPPIVVVFTDIGKPLRQRCLQKFLGLRYRIFTDALVVRIKALPGAVNRRHRAQRHSGHKSRNHCHFASPRSFGTARGIERPAPCKGIAVWQCSVAARKTVYIRDLWNDSDPQIFRALYFADYDIAVAGYERAHFRDSAIGYPEPARQGSVSYGKRVFGRHCLLQRDL